MKIVFVAIALSILFLGAITAHSRTLAALSERTVKSEAFVPKKMARTAIAFEVYQPF